MHLMSMASGLLWLHQVSLKAHVSSSARTVQVHLQLIFNNNLYAAFFLCTVLVFPLFCLSHPLQIMRRGGPTVKSYLKKNPLSLKSVQTVARSLSPWRVI